MAEKQLVFMQGGPKHNQTTHAPRQCQVLRFVLPRRLELVYRRNGFQTFRYEGIKEG